VSNVFVQEMTTRGVVCAPVQDQGWGVLTNVTLPGGGKLGVYEPRHARPPAANAGKAPAKKSRAAKKSAVAKKGRAGKKTRAVKKVAKKKPAARRR